MIVCGKRRQDQASMLQEQRSSAVAPILSSFHEPVAGFDKLFELAEGDVHPTSLTATTATN